MNAEEEVKKFIDKIQEVKNEIKKIIVGHDEIIDQILICLLAGGHALLEGVPGLGKTLLVRTLSKCLNLKFSRIQFTPDLMPADIIGTNIINENEKGKRYFEFQKGPVFGNVILADEINRATPKTQSALLEAMQEKSVTVGGEKHSLKEPFLVLATQNPIEMEGTYPLPEAQLDRFMFKIELNPSNTKELVEIIDRTTGKVNDEVENKLSSDDILKMRELVREVPIGEHVKTYAAKLTLATHPNKPESAEICKKYIRYGASPRGAQAMVLSGKITSLLKGRYNVSFEDVRDASYPALRHRLILNFEGEAEGISPNEIISKLLKEVPEVTKNVQKLVEP